jgi:hypothetical protein
VWAVAWKNWAKREEAANTAILLNLAEKSPDRDQAQKKLKLLLASETARGDSRPMLTLQR